MTDLSCDIIVVGAGVLGLCVAAELKARGRDVRVVDPGRGNASSVAAGMIAPAFETLLDGGDRERGALLRHAAGLWPAFAARHGIDLDVTPAEWRGPDPDGVLARLEALGFPVMRTTGGVAAADDVRVEAGASLALLKQGLGQACIPAEVLAIARFGDGWRLETGGGGLMAVHVVLATGVSSAIKGLPALPALLIAEIRPIKGQIGWTPERLTDRVLRGPNGYLAPGGGGTLIGATMVEDARDLTVDPEASARLLAMASALTGGSLPVEVEWRLGIRGATSDGRPMVGPTGGGLHLALAPRRNGWLLGPAVARAVADGIEGGAVVTAFDPLRFSPPAT